MTAPLPQEPVTAQPEGSLPNIDQPHTAPALPRWHTETAQDVAALVEKEIG